MLEVWEVPLPSAGHRDEVVLIRFPIVVAARPCGALIVFSLMPQDAADSVCQLRLLHAPEHPPVDRREVRRVSLVPLMLIDARASDGGIDDKDGHLLAFEQPLREFHAPPAEFGFLALLGLPHRQAPQVPGIVCGVLGGAPIAANPLVCLRRSFLARVRRERIRLTVDDIGIAANQVANRLDHRLAVAGLCAEFHFVSNQSRL